MWTLASIIRPADLAAAESRYPRPSFSARDLDVRLGAQRPRVAAGFHGQTAGVDPATYGKGGRSAPASFTSCCRPWRGRRREVIAARSDGCASNEEDRAATSPSDWLWVLYHARYVPRSARCAVFCLLRAR